MRATLVQTAVAIVALVATVAIWIIYVPSAMPLLQRVGVLNALGIEAQSATAPDQQRRPEGAVRVVAAPVTQGAMNNRVTAIGDGRAKRSVTLTAEAAGKIVTVDAVSGSFVEQGAQILKLDDEAERIAVERAKVMLKNAQDDVDRLSQLTGSGATTAVAIQAAQLALRTADLGVQDAELRLSQRVVLAPFSGWIGLMGVESGDRIQQQDQITVISDRSDILIDFSVPERVIGDLTIGGVVQIVPLANPDQPLSGVIDAIDSTVDRASRSLRVQGRVANGGDRLRPGMAFQVNLDFQGEALPSVPPLAVQWSSQGSFVWAIRDGKAVRVTAAIRQRNADSVLVDAALTEADMVVVEGVQSVRPGVAVEVVPAATTAAEPAPPTAAISPESL